MFAANVADGPPLSFARGQVATAQAVFAHVAAVAEAAIWRGRRFGNVVLLGSAAPLPVDELTRRCAGDPVPARVTAGAALTRFAAGAAVVTDATAVDSPEPPPPSSTADPPSPSKSIMQLPTRRASLQVSATEMEVDHAGADATLCMTCGVGRCR